MPDEIANCRGFLDETMQATPWKVVVCLGGLAWQQMSKALQLKLPKFGHGMESRLQDGRVLMASFHPSQQNTFTGKLTEPMFDSVFSRVRSLLDDGTP